MSAIDTESERGGVKFGPAFVSFGPLMFLVALIVVFTR